MENNNGYNTHILGTVSEVNNCPKIALYHSSEFQDTITLFNMDKIYSEIKNSDKGSILERESGEVPFIYDSGRSFNTIIYIGALDKSLGYTEFANVQGRSGSVLQISPKIVITVKDGGYFLSNSLSPAEEEERPQIGKLPYEYTSALDIQEPEKRQRYTLSLAQALRDGVISCSSLVVSAGDVTGLKFTRNGNANLYGVEFTNRNIGFYSGDLVVYSWLDGNKFCVTSLSKVNNFGNSIVYTKSGLGYIEIPETDAEIQYGAGRYIFYTSQGETKMYNFETKAEGEVVYGFIDPLDPSSEFRELPENLSIGNLKKSIPEIGNSYFNPDQLDSLGYKLSGFRKIGGWFIYEVYTTGNDSKTRYICSSEYTTITLEESEFKSGMFLNSGVIIIKTKDSYILRTGYLSNVLEYVVPRDRALLDTPFELFRRGPYPQELSKLPEFLGAGLGVIFYKSGYNISYL